MNFQIINTKYFRVTFLICIFFFLLGSLAAAKTGSGHSGLLKTQILDYKYLNANRIYLPLWNNSIFGQSNDIGKTLWPYPSTSDSYIFGSGLWIGAYDSVGTDSTGAPVWVPFVSVGYNPNDGSSEMASGPPPVDRFSKEPLYRILRTPEDLLEWPVEIPLFGSSQAAHLIFNDHDWTLFDQHESDGYTPQQRRLGVEVRQVSYVFAGPVEFDHDVIFLVYDITNKSNELMDTEGNLTYPDGKLLKDVYLGIACDADIGDASDDQYSYFKDIYPAPGIENALELSLGYAYDNDNSEASFTNPNGPGVVGLQFLKTPVATHDTYLDPQKTVFIPKGQEMGLTYLKGFSLSSDPQNDAQRMQFMQGFNPKNGNFNQFDESTAPDDQRFLMVTGPFDLAPEESVRLVVALIIKQDLTKLKNAAYNAQKFYNDGALSINTSVFDTIPKLYSIEDIPNDQGGWVKVNFLRSACDTDSLDYGKTSSPEFYTVEMDYGTDWIAAATTSAYGKPIYTVLVPTLKDSTAESDGLIKFRVIASMQEGNFVSNIKTGYSIDNLFPSVPQGLTAVLNGKTDVELYWSPNNEKDFRNYTIYKNKGEGFDKLDQTTDTTFVDSEIQPGIYYSYAVTATDFSGNESDLSGAVMINITNLEDETKMPIEYNLAQNYPNPFNPTTTIRYSVPEEAKVSIKVYNILGKEITTLVNSNRQTGKYSVIFDGSGLSSGTYYVVMKAGDFNKITKILLLK